MVRTPGNRHLSDAIAIVKTKHRRRNADVELRICDLVEPAGLEPATSCLQSMCGKYAVRYE